MARAPALTPQPARDRLAEMQALFDKYFAFAFPVFFIGMWVGITTLLWGLTGWWRLQAAYPAQQLETTRLVLRSQSGMMGLWVSLRSVLTLTATERGLKVTMSRLFAPFSRPFLVPWREIEAERGQMLFGPMTKLTFGSPGIGRLWIDTTAWERLASASGTGLAPSESNRITRGELIQGLVIQWVIAVGLVAAFLLYANRQSDIPVPWMIVVGIVAVVTGITQVVRYFRQVRLIKD